MAEKGSSRVLGVGAPTIHNLWLGEQTKIDSSISPGPGAGL